MGLALGLALLLVVLGVAIRRPRGVPEAAVAVPVALVCVASGLLPLDAAWEQLRDIGPTLGFLVAVLVLARLCAAEGLFAWAGYVLARAARGRPTSLLGWTVGVGAAVTTALSLDATVVLFTPVVIATAAAAGLVAWPFVHATVHVANSASLLLPVANLTNLLVLEASGLSVGRFAALMLLPSIAVLAVEYLGTRRCFAGDLRARGTACPPSFVPVPRLALAVLIATIVGFLGSEAAGVPPGIVAGVGAAVLGVPALLRGRVRPSEVLGAADPPFLAFVASLAVVVAAVSAQGLDDVVRPLVDHDPTLAGLLAVALVGAVAANLLNNLPAVLLLLPLALPVGGPAAVLALLIGVNVGPNLTYVGSLATMLWLRVCRQGGIHPRLADFTRHALWTTLPAILVATLALWLSIRLVGV
ncbi:MAG: SLC13 family permease [Sporichthyaceae bacterium]